ncbi:MAG: DASH complex subunit dad4 [Phylliscum demangeonii]|nr:MAG: DASH complex subunit dad4 [Phylliscum demangeonii]
MESPHELQQSLLLTRIIKNVEKLNEAIVSLNQNLQEINIQNMNVELVAQMFRNYQSNVLFHLEGELFRHGLAKLEGLVVLRSSFVDSNGKLTGAFMMEVDECDGLNGGCSVRPGGIGG